MLINPPALKANIPAAKLINAGPANNKFAKLMPANPSMPSANIGKLFATKVSPMPNGINASPNAPMATAPANINGNANPSAAAPTPNVINPAANTPIVPMPTSFIKLSPNAIGIIDAPSMATAAAPFIIAVEPLPNICANAASPPTAIVPLITEANSTSLNFLSPIAANATAPPNKAKLAAPLTTLLSPNFATPSAILFRKPPLLPPPVTLVASLSVILAPSFWKLPNFSAIFLPVLLCVTFDTAL